MPPHAWEPAGAQLAKALRFDDSLFAIEEQNLFIDEVRESNRWAAVLEDVFSPSSPAVSSSSTALTEWTSAGLDSLLDITSPADRDIAADDGPLGWASDPEVYAVCARILLCATALARAGAAGSELLRSKLERFRSAGQRARLHGLLLDEAVV
ncbi:hypothetical protein CH063_12261 [Colletotrichum higginsianum]|uniref:Uncharacterized protein n=1 Tax=Colletotrichum higginsianum (strain IMI 349063) TaxID=759273 RepID=H1VPN8_COLHI|nr:hypothetical protein CH063_12261 [Colletotrichum higginsianum]